MFVFVITILDTILNNFIKSPNRGLPRKITHIFTQGKIPIVKLPHVESLRVPLLRAKLSWIGNMTVDDNSGRPSKKSLSVWNNICTVPYPGKNHWGQQCSGLYYTYYEYSWQSYPWTSQS